MMRNGLCCDRKLTVTDAGVARSFPDMIAKKTCSACGKRLSEAAFNGSARSRDGLAGACRACTNARRRQRERTADRRSTAKAGPARLAAALRQGDLATVQKLIRGGMTPHWSWICETMREGHLDLAIAILKAGVERNVFTLAAVADAKGLAQRLRRAPADARLTVNFEPASERVTALHVACASDFKPLGANCMAAQVRVAELLVDCGAELDAAARYRGIDGATPLFCACWSAENLALVRWLLARGAQANTEHLVAALGHFQRHGRAAYGIAQALVDCGVPLDGAHGGGRTLLQTFAHQAAHRTVAWLLANGAEVNARGPGGRTAAHFAAERNTGPKTLALLVAHGADLIARDLDGRTPLAIARRHGKTRLAEWIATRMNAKAPDV
jgi:ankyrin repeat protein